MQEIILKKAPKSRLELFFLLKNDSNQIRISCLRDNFLTKSLVPSLVFVLKVPDSRCQHRPSAPLPNT